MFAIFLILFTFISFFLGALDLVREIQYKIEGRTEFYFSKYFVYQTIVFFFIDVFYVFLLKIVYDDWKYVKGKEIDVELADKE